LTKNDPKYWYYANNFPIPDDNTLDSTIEDPEATRMPDMKDKDEDEEETTRERHQAEITGYKGKIEEYRGEIESK